MLNVFVLVAATTAGIFDLRWKRIPNWLVLVTVLTALVWHTVMGGWAGLWMSVAGLLVGTAILLPFFLLRGLGAGDVKFFGALSAAVTFKYVFTFFFFSAVIAGVMALVRIIWGQAITATLRRFAGLVSWFGRGHLSPHPTLNLANPGVVAVPFAVSIAAAAWIVVLFGMP